MKLIWSYIIDYENEQNPYEERKRVIKKWKQLSETDIEENELIIKSAKELEREGLHGKDALHIACEIEAKAEYFLTTDDFIEKTMKGNKEIQVINPVDFVKKIEE